LNGQFGLTACRSTATPGFDIVFLNTGDNRSVGSQAAGVDNFCGFAFGGSFLFLTESEALACNSLVRRKAAARARRFDLKRRFPSLAVLIAPFALTASAAWAGGATFYGVE
jgi:hypothetical protein